MYFLLTNTSGMTEVMHCLLNSCDTMQLILKTKAIILDRITTLLLMVQLSYSPIQLC